MAPLRGPPPAAIAARIFSSAFAPSPATSRTRSVSHATRSSSTVVTPSASNSFRVVFAPTPGRCMISTRPGGYFASSFSSAASDPVSRSSVTFAAIVSPTSGSSVSRPSSDSRIADSPVDRIRAAALRYASTR